jgi:hypothetical protein
MMRGFELVNRHISAIGDRWGIVAEDAFREGLRGILEKEFGVKVERWITRDEEGLVYGFSSVIEIDIPIKDGKTMLIEISSSVDRSKVAAFLRKAKLYEKETGIKHERLVMVTPYAEDIAIEAAKEVSVAIYTTAKVSVHESPVIRQRPRQTAISEDERLGIRPPPPHTEPGDWKPLSRVEHGLLLS